MICFNLQLVKRLIYTLLLIQSTIYAQDISYTGNGSDDSWDTSLNWNNGNIPNSIATGAAFYNNSTHVIIDSSTNATCRGFMLECMALPTQQKSVEEN